MAGNIFSSALSGMNAAQVALTTTQHNISNANTPGFTRQETMTSARPGIQFGGGFIGQGVDVVGVTRMYDQFLSTQVLQEQAQSTYLSSYHTALKQIDNLIADPAAGAAPAMRDFFSAVNGMANSPESIPARQTVLSNAQYAVNRFQAIDRRLTDIANGLTDQVSASVNQINNYAKQIAALNGNIKRAMGSGAVPNDLMDQRDQLVTLLNKEVKATTLRQPDGTLNVLIGSGQSLVIDEQSMPLQVVQSPRDPSKVDVAYNINNTTVVLQQSSIQGGNLGAYLTFRDQTLEPMRNELGRVALGMAMSVNQQNQTGLDLRGQLGGNIFHAAAPRVDVGAYNQGTALISAAIADLGALTTSDYQLKVNGVDNYTLVRLSDNKVTNITSPLPQTIDGFTINLASGVATSGDSFLIRPTANAARDISVLTSDPSVIAAAAPMRGIAGTIDPVSGALVSANTGTGMIGSGQVNMSSVTIKFSDPALPPQTYTVTDSSGAAATVTGNYVAGNPIDYNGWTVQISGAPGANDIFNVVRNINSTTSAQMSASPAVTNVGTGTISPPSAAVAWTTPFTVTFNATAQTYTVTGAVPDVSATPIAYTPGSPINMSYNGWTAQITGAPADGDVFNFVPNKSATGDNSNALQLAALQTTSIFANGTTSLQAAYSQLVGNVGAKTNELAVTSEAQLNMVNESIKQQQSFSGVNLDEEAANLLRYQRAYEAAAKALQISNSMFDAVLALGR
jgi:flagellar hook-associated protein 1 FlgK